MAQKHILIICGEASGDLHAANLIRDIKKINPLIRISGVGGQLMRASGASILSDIKDLSAIGLFDVLKKLPKFFALKELILRKIRQDKPDAVIFVDFSGFNLRLAKQINKTIKTIYYISPQVWASRAGRVKTIKKYISKMIVFFKFEEGFYKRYGVDVDCVGHPLLDIVTIKVGKKDASKTTIALLPGSRQTEIKYILPVMLKASLCISKKIKDAQFLLAKSPQVDRDIYQRLTKGAKLDLKIVEGKTYDCINLADFCLVASGTATLETAILEKPFCVIYKMHPLNYFFYRPQIKIPYISLVNILAERKIVPEFIQFRAVPKKIAQEATRIIQNPAEIERIKKDLVYLKSLLGEKGASQRAAQIIVDFI